MARTKKHPGTIEKRGTSQRVILYSEGVRHTFTLPNASRTEAVAFACAKGEELDGLTKRKALGLPGPLPFSALLSRYEAEKLPTLTANTRRSYSGSLDRFREYFVKRERDPFVSEIRSGHVKGFLAWRRLHVRQGGVAPGPVTEIKTASNRTLQKDRAVLHALMQFASELELIDANPVGKVKPPKADTRDPVILTEDQYDALIAACEDRPMLRLYALALGETGGRCESEVLWLQWDDVDFEGGFLWIASGRGGHRTKGGKGRWVPMTARLKDAIREHFASYRFASYGGKRSPWVFHHTRTLRHAVAGGRIGSIRRAFDAAAKRAGLPDTLHQHDLRHRRVTTWLAAGANPVHVKEAVGHSDLRTTMGYTHLAREHLRSLVPEEEPRERLRDLGS